MKTAPSTGLIRTITPRQAHGVVSLDFDFECFSFLSHSLRVDDVHFAYTNNNPFFNYDCDCVNKCTAENIANGMCGQVNETLADCCVVAGIEKYRDELYLQIVENKKNETAGVGNTYNVSIQTMLLAHFAGDIHQPLHVGLYNDKGGNTFLVDFFGNSTCGFAPYTHHCQLHEVCTFKLQLISQEIHLLIFFLRFGIRFLLICVLMNTELIRRIPTVLTPEN